MLSLLLLAIAGGASVATAASPTDTALQSESRCDVDCPARPAVVAAAPTGAATPDRPSRTDRSLARLNVLRTGAGAQPVSRSELLTASASHHAAYLSRNGFRSATSVHAETAGLAEFTGADPFSRMRAVGYRASYATEVVGDIGSTSTDSDCVDHLMSTVYHAALLLSRVTEGGAAYGTGAAAGACVIDLGATLAAQPAAAAAPGHIVRYPWPGMTAPTGALRLDSETPRPAPGQLPEAIVGIPVLVGLRAAGPTAAGSGARRIEIQDFELRDARDVPVASVILADAAMTGPAIVADTALHGGFAALIPRKPLESGRYRVVFRATIGAEVIAPTPWTFTVAPLDTR